MIDTIEIVGLCAATLTTAAFLPQVYRAWKTKDLSGISLTMYISLFVGVILWLIYGIFKNSLSIILANIITSVSALLIIVLKINHIVKKKEVKRKSSSLTSS